MNRQDWAMGAGTLAAGLAIGALAVNTRIYPPGSYTPGARPTPKPTPCPICPTPSPEPTPDPNPSPTVEPSPTPTPAPTPTPGLPPLPLKVQWEYNMTNEGRRWCEEEKKAVTAWKAGAAIDPAMSYYDGEEVYWKIFEYVKPSDAYWKDCSQVVESAYRGVPPPAGAVLPDNKYGYLFGNNGSLPGYWGFSSGITMDFDRTQDVNSRDAVFLLSEHGAYCVESTTDRSNATLSREVAYCGRHFMNAERMGHTHRDMQDRYVNYMFAHIESWASGTYRMPPGTDVPAATGMYYIQPFMVGITMRSLIMQYEATQDAVLRQKIYEQVKRIAIFMHSIAWDPNSKAWWYDNWAPTVAELPAKPGAPDLNMLILPAFGWLYSIDRDRNWITIADQAFEGGVQGAWLGGTKQFNQNYTWSFEYVKWRSSPGAVR